jgi:hypothetical protein
VEKSSQVAWKIVPLRHFFPLKVVPLIEVLLYRQTINLADWRSTLGEEEEEIASFQPHQAV